MYLTWIIQNCHTKTNVRIKDYPEIRGKIEWCPIFSQSDSNRVEWWTWGFRWTYGGGTGALMNADWEMQLATGEWIS